MAHAPGLLSPGRVLLRVVQAEARLPDPFLRPRRCESIRTLRLHGLSGKDSSERVRRRPAEVTPASGTQLLSPLVCLHNPRALQTGPIKGCFKEHATFIRQAKRVSFCS
jgi:hypothetical protein